MKEQEPAAGSRALDPHDESRYLSLCLIRHGQIGDEYRANEIGPRLTPLGERQAAKAALRFAEQSFDCIYSSDAQRALDTAKAMLEHHPETRYVISSDIREISGWHGRRRMVNLPLTRRVRIERRRVRRFCDKLLADHPPGQRVLIVAHGNLIRYLISLLAGVSPNRGIALETRHTGVFMLQAYRRKEPQFNARAVVSLANCVKHLESDEIS